MDEFRIDYTLLRRTGGHQYEVRITEAGRGEADRRGLAVIPCCDDHNTNPDHGIWCDRNSHCCGRCPSQENPPPAPAPYSPDGES